MPSTATQPLRFVIPALLGLVTGVLFGWQFRTDTIWVGVPFGILGGIAAALLVSLPLEILFGTRDRSAGEGASHLPS